MQGFRLALIFVSAMVFVGVQAGVDEPPSAGAAFPGANGKIVFITAAHGIRMVNPDGGDLQTILGTVGASEPSSSPDGQRIAFQLEGDIYTIDADGSNKENLTNSPTIESSPEWSPDGTQIAFFRRPAVPNPQGTYELWTVNANGTGAADAGGGPIWHGSGMSWSPDGQFIVAGVGDGTGTGTNDLYRLTVATSAVDNLTNTPWVVDSDQRSESEPDWSPDGQTILYSRSVPNQQGSAVWVMDAEGSNQHQVMTGMGSGFEWQATWSPDGTQIVTRAVTQDSAPGGELFQIWTGPDFASSVGVPNTELGAYPDWQPLPGPVHSMEFTQGIQELQTLSELHASLGGPGPARAAPQAFPGENGLIVFSTSQIQPSGIYAIPAEGGAPQFVTSGASPAISADGDEILFMDVGGISKIHVDGTHKQQVVADSPGSEHWSSPAWSPDDTRIAVLRHVTGGAFTVSELWIMDTDGSNRTELLATSAQFDTLNHPRWSPDGKKILVGREVQATQDDFLVTVDVTTLVETRITPGSNAFWGDWSPDGSQLVYATSGGGIYISDANGTGAHQVGTESSLGYPVWSPDGSRILAHVLGQFIAKSMNLDGSDPVTVTDKSTGGEDWGPAGASLLALEFTQGIQELQTVSSLRSDIAADGQPPVPIVAGKPAAMRVYFAEVDQATDYMIEVSGEVSDTEVVTLTPGCTPLDRRRQDAGCTSVDFFFTPPQGEWSVRLVVNDISDQVVLDEEFTLRSVDTAGLVVKYTPICVRLTAGAVPTCPSNFVHTTAPDLMKKLFPVADNELFYDQLAIPNMVLNATVTEAGEEALLAGLRQRYELMSQGGFVADQLAAWLPNGSVPSGTTGFADPVWGGSTGRVSWQLDTSATDPLDAQHTLTHEIGHNLGLRHTNLPDGCGAEDSTTDWPYADSTIQEVGYDVAAQQVKLPTKKDLMTYCTPPGSDIWISAHTYNEVLTGNFNPQSARVEPAGSPNPYLVVKGTAQADGSSATIESSYVISSSKPAEVPNPMGNYCLRTTGGAQIDYCFMLRFQDHRTGQPLDSESFAVRIPLPPGTTRISLAEGFHELDSLDLSASAPTVDIADPGEWNGEETLDWSASDADGDPLQYAVMYSPDDGDTWLPIEVDTTETEFTFDTSVLEGNEVLVRVLASDGLNTTIETTGPIPVQHGEQRTWGDNNCSGNADPVDALLALRFDAGLPTNTGACPAMGVVVDVLGASPHPWGDIDCTGEVGPVDGLKLLRFDSGLSVSQEPGCPLVGTTVNVAASTAAAQAGRWRRLTLRR
ncbi:MAG: hypothetical protein WD904_11220 [Dehalococcoidia bacterium]